MPYYQGDFYQGDFYGGDPGIFGFLGRAVKTAVGFIPGVGGIASKVLGRVGRKTAPTALARIGSAPIVQRTATLARAAGGAIAKHPVLTAAAAVGTVGAVGGRMLAPGVHPAAMAAMGGQKGFHVSKRTGAMVRNRRMNVCNPRALRRSLRRAHGFAKLAMHTIHLIHPKKKGRFGGFKKRKRARV